MSKISIFGLGYVGSVMAGCLAEEGHSIIGVDSNLTKVDSINSGRSPVIEKDLNPMIAKGLNAGYIQATKKGKYAIFSTDISFICVGTPGHQNPNCKIYCDDVDNAKNFLDVGVLNISGRKYTENYVLWNSSTSYVNG